MNVQKLDAPNSLGENYKEVTHNMGIYLLYDVEIDLYYAFIDIDVNNITSLNLVIENEIPDGSNASLFLKFSNMDNRRPLSIVFNDKFGDSKVTQQGIELVIYTDYTLDFKEWALNYLDYWYGDGSKPTNYIEVGAHAIVGTTYGISVENIDNALRVMTYSSDVIGSYDSDAYVSIFISTLEEYERLVKEVNELGSYRGASLLQISFDIELNLPTGYTIDETIYLNVVSLNVSVNSSINATTSLFRVDGKFYNFAFIAYETFTTTKAVLLQFPGTAEKASGCSAYLYGIEQTQIGSGSSATEGLVTLNAMTADITAKNIVFNNCWIGMSIQANTINIILDDCKFYAKGDSQDSLLYSQDSLLYTNTDSNLSIARVASITVILLPNSTSTLPNVVYYQKPQALNTINPQGIIYTDGETALSFTA